MRAKIANRLRRECVRRGAVIKDEHFTKEPGWKRKDCGVCVYAEYKGGKIVSIAHDYLEAYRMLLECIDWEDEGGLESHGKTD